MHLLDFLLLLLIAKLAEHICQLGEDLRGLCWCKTLCEPLPVFHPANAAASLVEYTP